MKKIMSNFNQKVNYFSWYLITGLGAFLSFPLPIKAAGESAIGTLEPPVKIKLGDNEVDPNNPNQVVADTIFWLLNLAFGVAVILVLANLIWGAYQWIMSGGKSEKIAAGRNRMIWSVIGLIMVAASFGITVVVKQILTGDGTITVDLIPQ